VMTCGHEKFPIVFKGENTGLAYCPHCHQVSAWCIMPAVEVVGLKADVKKLQSRVYCKDCKWYVPDYATFRCSRSPSPAMHYINENCPGFEAKETEKPAETPDERRTRMLQFVDGLRETTKLHPFVVRNVQNKPRRSFWRLWIW